MNEYDQEIWVGEVYVLFIKLSTLSITECQHPEIINTKGLYNAFAVTKPNQAIVVVKLLQTVFVYAHCKHV